MTWRQMWERLAGIDGTGFESVKMSGRNAIGSVDDNVRAAASLVISGSEQSVISSRVDS